VPLYRLTLAYDGTDFEGWQAQAVSRPARTVQGVLEAALAPLAGGERVRVAGAGRTDAGVHASGQVASFELPREMAPPDLARALNGLLPDDVRVLAAERAPAGFHARRSAVSKLYRYTFDTAPLLLPTRRRTVAHLPGRFDPEAASTAARLFLGRHDFASLASSGSSVKTTERTVRRSELRRADAGAVGDAFAAAGAGTCWVYEVEADGFLRRMVRSLVGGLTAVGRGQLTLNELWVALAARDRRAWPPPAPACGLCLVRVDYPREAPGLE